MAFPSIAKACQEVDKNDFISKFVGKWAWTGTGGEGGPEFDGSSEISIVDGNSLEVITKFNGFSMRQTISNPKEDSFTITTFQKNDDETFDEISTWKFVRQSNLPMIKPETPKAASDQKEQPQAKRPTREELEKYLGDWEIVSELSVDGLVSPISSEGVAPPGGDSKCYMRVRNDYLINFGWNEIRRFSAEKDTDKEYADEVEWTDIDENGLHGELYLTIEGIRRHVRNCVMKVTGKRSLLRVDHAEDPHRVKDPFGLIKKNDIHYPTIHSMIRVETLNAKDRR